MIAGKGSRGRSQAHASEAAYDYENEAELDFSDQLEPVNHEDYEYDHGDFVHNDSYMFSGNQIQYNASEVSAYTSWQ